MEAPGGLEPPIEILQTSALPLGDGALLVTMNEKMEREKGFEPSTSTLARLHSTTELLPLIFMQWGEIPEPNYISSNGIVKLYFFKNFASVPSINRRMLS